MLLFLRCIDHLLTSVKAPALAEAQAQLTITEDALEAANAALSAAEYFLVEPAYITAKTTLDMCRSALDAARGAAAGALSAAEAAFNTTQYYQKQLVDAAAQVFAQVEQAGQAAVNEALKAAQDFKSTADKTLAGLSDAVAAVSDTAYKAAEASLKVAQAARSGIQTAENGVKAAEQGASDLLLEAISWIAKNGSGIFDPSSVLVSGDLRGVINRTSPLEARIEGAFMSKPMDLTVDFVPGEGEEMIRVIFDKLVPKNVV